MCGGKYKLEGSSSKDKGELKGDLLIRDLWTQGTDSIHDMRVVNTDAVSHQSKNPKKFLETAESDKKKNYLHACLNEHRHLTPFISLLDILLGVKAGATLKRIASRLVTNREIPIQIPEGT